MSDRAETRRRPYRGTLPRQVPPLDPYAPPAPLPPQPRKAPPISPIMACAVTYRFQVQAPPMRVVEGVYSARAALDGRCTFAEVLAAVLAAWPEVAKNDLFSPRRDRHFAYPRLALYALLKEFASWSLPRIGHAIGRDHTTVMSGVRRVREIARTDEEFAAAFDAARRALLDLIEGRRSPRPQGATP